MINRTNPVRRHSRFPVRWPVVYRGQEFLAEGTVLDLTRIGWRLAGSMPVTPGMQLSLQLTVSDRSEPVRIERATVLWVKDCEFAIEVQEMTPTDQAWVNEFLHQKLGLPWISDATDGGEPFRMVDGEPPVDSNIEDSSLGHCEDTLRICVANQIPTQAIEDEVISRCMARHGCEEGHALAAYRQFVQKTWQPPLRIVRGMIARKVQRELTGRDPIADN